MKNNYITENNHIKIFLHRRNKSDLELVIDLEDFDKINSFNGTFYSSLNRANGLYYAKITLYLGLFNGKPKYRTMFVHRIILDCTDRKIQVDHYNHNGLDNRKENLRIASYQTNASNRKHENSNNKTGHRNVCYFDGWYLVQLQKDGKNNVVLKTKDYGDACSVANKARIKYYGEFSGNNNE